MKINDYLPKGAEYELRSERTISSNVRFEGNRFERIDSADQTSLTARVMCENKLSTAGGSRPGSGEELIKQAADMVKHGSPYNVPFVGKTDLTQLNLLDREKMTSKQMIEMMGDFVEDLRSLDDRLVAGATLNSEFIDVSLKTSSGFDHSYSKSVWSCDGFISLVQGDDLLNLYEFRKDIRPSFDLKQLKETLARKLEYAINVVTIEAGSYPVIFAPSEVGNIVNPITASMNGQAIYRKVSPWSEKLGQKLLDTRFTLTDDGSLDKSWTSKPFDLEGTPTKQYALIKKGCLSDIVLDRKVAGQLGKESSGNAGAAGPTPNYLQIEAGSKTLDELIREIDYGLLIDDTMGAWSGNPFSGIVTGTISMGYKIEKGKIVGRVKDCMFTINAFEHFNKHLIDYSVEREQTQSMFFAAGCFPYILLDEVVISTD